MLSSRVINQTIEALLAERRSRSSSPFEKERDHFIAEEKMAELPYHDDTHAVTKLQKKHRRSVSPTRNDTHWYKISNRTIKPESKNWLYEMCVFSGELSRFDVGSLQPKYRIVKDSAGDSALISKELKDAEEFMTFLEKLEKPGHGLVFDKSHLLEGTGRVVVSEWFKQQDDLHFGNLYKVEKNGYAVLVSIDPDRSFWALTSQAHDISSTTVPVAKELGYNLDGHDGKALFLDFTLVQGMAQHEIGSVSYKDYDSLPEVKYLLSTRWQFNQKCMLEYSRALARDELFNNEKHLTLLKLMTSTSIRGFILRYHFPDRSSVIHKFISELLINDFHQIINIYNHSEAFKNYVNKNHMGALCAILYESNQFFKDNKHYLPRDNAEWLAQWEVLSESIITTLCIDSGDVNKLRKDAMDIEINPIAILPKLVAFYTEQLMMQRADECQLKKDALLAAAFQEKLTLRSHSPRFFAAIIVGSESGNESEQGSSPSPELESNSDRTSSNSCSR